MHDMGQVTCCGAQRGPDCMSNACNGPSAPAALTPELTSTEHKDGTHTQYTGYPELPRPANKSTRTSSSGQGGKRRADNTLNETSGTWESGLSPTQRPSSLRPDMREQSQLRECCPWLDNSDRTLTRSRLTSPPRLYDRILLAIPRQKL